MNSLAMAFNGFIWWWLGSQSALEWSTGYLVELCLSVDNVFVFILIFTYFKVPAKHQHRVLFWGIVGAALMRFVFIVAGVSLLERFHWLIYVFGAFLVLTGIKMALPKKEEFEPEKNIAVRAVILAFIGSKMLLTSIDVHIPIGLSLGIIATVLAVSVIASLAIAPISKGEAALAEEG